MKNRRTCLDLFAGAGGLSLGFEQAGCDIIAALEKDDWAVETYKNNHKNTKIIAEDIRKIDSSTFKKFRGVDFVIGGPPCQGFSISASNRRKENDPRNYLYQHFIRAVAVIKPEIVLVENVKEIINAKLLQGASLLDDFIQRLNALGYTTSYRLINAKFLGVPQDRIRFIMVGSKKGAVSLENIETFGTHPHLLKENKKLLTIMDAISDLPEVTGNIKFEDDTRLDYRCEPKNEYQKKLRIGSRGILNHVPMRHTKRIIERFNLIPIGGSMLSVPTEHAARTRGKPEELSGKVYHQNHRRLEPDKPSRTITASFYSSFIHPFQNRNLTIREAARIQSFPDKYQFFGKRSRLSEKLLAKKGITEDIHLDQFNQVGNAIPPLMAKVIADKLILFLNGKN